MKKSLIFSLMLSLASVTYSQLTPGWIAHLSGAANDEIHAITSDNSGYIYVTGTHFSAASQEDYITIKYSSNGVQQWVSSYNGPANSYDVALSIAADNSGNVYVTGYSSGGSTGVDCATVKYNSSGTQEWVQRYNGPINGYDAGRSIIIDGSANLFVTGYTAKSSGSDIITLKYNSAGTLVWSVAYDGAAHGFDEGISIAMDNSGNIYTAGNNISNASGLTDYVTIKYNSSGVQQWATVYNGPANRTDVLTEVKTDNASNIYVTGHTDGASHFDCYATVKYNSAGLLQWVQRYNGALGFYDRANSLGVDGSGNVYVTGFSQESGTSTSATTIKYNTGGVQQWRVSYNDTLGYSDEPFSLTLDNSGNVSITGTFSYRLGVIKYSSSGSMIWNGFHGNNFDTYANVLTVDNSGVYAAGTDGSGCLTVKFVQTPPVAPVLLTPPNDTTMIAPLFIRHRWAKQPGSKYHFQLATDSLFTAIVVNDSSLTDTMKVTVGALPNTTYWWHVKAWNYFGTSPWSVTWRYHIG